jgi:predicted nucleic acid-binding protein
MKPCFLDTCAVIQILSGDQAPVDAIEDYDEVLISHVVLGELIFGCHRSANPEREHARIFAWLPSVSVITATPETAEIYGELAADLETRGIRIPQNDLWIAALSVQCGLPLVSSDAHFSRPRGLQWISYPA